MTQNIKVSDFVKVVGGCSGYDLWRNVMDGYVNNGICYLVNEIDDDGDVILNGINYVFPPESLEVINYVDYIEDSNKYENPTEAKQVFSRMNSIETYDTEREAMIAHYEELVKEHILFRGNFNINTAIENVDNLIDIMNQIKYFKLDKVEE